MLTLADMPDVKLTAKGGYRQSQPLTMANVKAVLEHLDTKLRFDMMRGRMAFVVEDEIVPPDGEGYVVEIMSDILVKLDINSLGRLDSVLLELARLDPFHPMEDWLRSQTWDDEDHIARLADTVTTHNPLWPTYLENWLVQVVAGVSGWRGGGLSLPHVLVLVGGQGIGKSHWLAQLGAGWFKGEAELHLASSSGKDHQLAALQHPMVELSELDGIFRKSDVSHLKAFISREEDEIRAPYARRALVQPRMTSFCGSVNDAEFLNDGTGSRRFWPVQVESIDWQADIAWEQVWAQAFAFWQEDPGFNLTPEQDAQREGTAMEQHTQLPAEVEYLSSFFAAHRHLTDTYRAMNGTEILRMLGYRNPGPKTVGDVKRWLVINVGKARTLSGKQRSWMFPHSDFGSDPAVWPDTNHLGSSK